MSDELTIGSLCTGYGGLDDAVQAVFGGELAWWSDIEPTVAETRYPNAPNERSGQARHGWVGSQDGDPSTPDTESYGRHQGGGAESTGLVGGPDVAERCGSAASDTRSTGLEVRSIEPRRSELPATERDSGVDWGEYGPAIRRWEAILGRDVPRPTTIGRRGARVLNPELSEWLMGLPAGLVTNVPGLSRTRQLQYIGNGVVPQQAEFALRQLVRVFE